MLNWKKYENWVKDKTQGAGYGESRHFVTAQNELPRKPNMRTSVGPHSDG
jgi:hypothetical protein